MSKVVAQVTPAHLKNRLEQDREVDFSYFVPGIGRFRTDLFRNRPAEPSYGEGGGYGKMTG
jgi:Tfp pilus assembly pilus retraction ATPase PilT